jgi:subtilisin family serine protease
MASQSIVDTTHLESLVLDARRRLSIAVIDSGINPHHPHVGGIAGGVGITAEGVEHEDYVDRLGHGTAVAAAIREKSPASALFAVKVFDRSLSTDINALVRAIDWSVRAGVRLVNLSLGTGNSAHEGVLREAVGRALACHVIIVSAFEQDGVRWLPGSLPGVIGVKLDWDCPREECRVEQTRDGSFVFRASGYPRDIPGVPPSRNLRGISFAVANVTGLLARALEACSEASFERALDLLVARAAFQQNPS